MPLPSELTTPPVKNMYFAISGGSYSTRPRSKPIEGSFLFVFDRPSSYLGLGAVAYGGALWLITRFCIRLDVESEEGALKATFVLVIPGRQLLWHSSILAAIQRFSAPVHLGHDSAVPNFVVYALVPGLLLFALGAKPIELGLMPWRKGGSLALLGAPVLPAQFLEQRL
jgi:hypothetical protein